METAELSEIAAPAVFEDQFKKRESLNLPEGNVTVVEVSPDILKDEVPVLLASGWSENHDTYKKTLGVGFDEGRKIFSVGFPSRPDRASSDTGFPEEEFKKAQMLLGVLEKKGIEKADVIAHSEGAINVLIAALLKPEQFRNIVLDKPAGFIGKDSKVALGARFVKLLLQEAAARPAAVTDPTSSVRAGARTLKYVTENPAKVLREMDGLTSVDITSLMTKLSSQDIKVSVIAGVDDPLFSVGRQIQNMRETGIVPPINGYYSVVGGHNELSINADQHARLAFNALENLQYSRVKTPSLAVSN